MAKSSKSTLGRQEVHQSYLMLTSEGRHRASHAPSLKEFGAGWRKGEARTLTGISAMSFLQSFDAVPLITGRAASVQKRWHHFWDFWRQKRLGSCSWKTVVKTEVRVMSLRRKSWSEETRWENNGKDDGHRLLSLVSDDSL